MNEYDHSPKRVKERREFSRYYSASGKKKEWNHKNKNKIQEYNKKRRNRNHDITNEEWIICKNYFNYCCAYCGMTIKEHYIKYNQDLHKEHVNPKGNKINNCVPSCKQCNSEKWEYEFDQWYNIKNAKFTIERYNKIINWINNDWKTTIEEVKNE